MDLIKLLEDSEQYNKAHAILADPRQALRLELAKLDAKCQQNPEQFFTSNDFSEIANKIKSLLPNYYTGKELEHEQDAFDRELARVHQAIKTGSSKDTIIAGRADKSGPNLYSPERMLLWFAAISHMEHKPADSAAQNFGIQEIANELARSKGADYLLDKFSCHVTSILPAIGVDKRDCIIRWGEPNSHFWHSKKDPANGQLQNIINFDIKKTMLLGDMVQQVMVHELGHYLYDTKYPPVIEQKQKNVLTLQAKARKGQASQDEQKELVRETYALKLYHGVWNAAADNAVDEASHRLSSGENPRYRYGLLPALLANFVTLRGQGSLIQEYAEQGPPPAKKVAEMAKNPQAALAHLSTTLVQVSSLLHGQMSNPQERAALMADLPKIGIHTELLKNQMHPEMTGEECYWNLYEKCKRIAELTPDPTLMLQQTEWVQKRDAMQEQRNQIHEAIFTEYAKPLIEQIMDKQKSLQEMIDEMAKEVNTKPGQSIPINIPGAGGGIPVFIPAQPGSHAPSTPGQGVGKEGTVVEHEKGWHNGENDRDPEAPVTAGSKKPAMGGLDKIRQFKSGHKGAGKASDAFIDIELGDGRTLEELKSTDEWVDAVDLMYERFKKTLALQEIPVLALGTNYSLLPDRKKPLRQLDIQKARELDRKPLTSLNQLKLMKTHEQVGTISPIINEIIAIDTSGSMGWGKGSDAEKAIKAAAIRVMAIEKLNEERERNHQQPIGVYVTLWGNTIPSFLGKPYDKDQTKEIMLKLDQLLADVLNGRVPHGVGGGTEIMGVLKETLAELAYHRPEGLDGYRDPNFCGMTHLIFASDGGTFDSAPFKEVLDQNPSLMVSALLTSGQNTRLETDLKQAEGVRSYQKPAIRFMPNDKGILHALAELAEENIEKIGTAVKHNECPRAFAERNVRQAAEESLTEIFGEDYTKHQRNLTIHKLQTNQSPSDHIRK